MLTKLKRKMEAEQMTRKNGHRFATDTAGDTTTGHHSRGRAPLKPEMSPGKKRNGPNEKTHDKIDEKKVLMDHLQESVKRQFPRLHHEVHFVPPVYFNRTNSEPLTTEGVQVKVITPCKQLSDVRENEAHSRVHHTLYHFFQNLQRPKEPPERQGIMGVWGLDFDTYLNNLGVYDAGKQELSPREAKQAKLSASEPNHRDKTAPAKSVHRVRPPFVRPRDLTTDLQRGTFDVLLFAKEHGMIICEIKAMGDAFGLAAPGAGQVNPLEIIRGKTKKALKQLEKERTVLRRLTVDLDSSLDIRCSLILPNLKRQTLEQALQADQNLRADFCRTLDCTNLSEALQRCLLAEQLPSIGRHWELGDEVMEKLKNWWRRLAGATPINPPVYEALIGRFCGPATPLHVNTACRSRVEASTLAEAVCETADCFKDWTLTAEQINAVKHDGENQVYLTGPPGTGKTTMLVLMALKWIHRGHVVHVISLWTGSVAASFHLIRLIRDRLPADQHNMVRLLTNRTGNLEDIIKRLEDSVDGRAIHDDSQQRADNTSAPSAVRDNTGIHGVGDVEMRSPAADQQPEEESEEEEDKPSRTLKKTSSEAKLQADAQTLPNGTLEDLDMDGVEENPTDSVAGRTFGDANRSQSLPGSSDFKPSPATEPSQAATSHTTQASTKPLPQTKGNSSLPASTPAPHRAKAGHGSRSVYLLFDEASWLFPNFMQRLESKRPSFNLHVRAASQIFGSRPKDFTEVKLTQCLRCPPVVTRVLETGAAYTTRAQYHYATGDAGTLSSKPPPTDGPPVKWLTHDRHRAADVWDCEDCGKTVAKFLHEDLGIGKPTSDDSQKRSLKYSDVIISGHVTATADDNAALCKTNVVGTSHVLSIRRQKSQTEDEGTADKNTRKPNSGFLRGLRLERVPFDVITKNDADFPRKLSSPDKPNCVQVAEPECILGLKWAVVVVIGTTDMSATFPRYVDPWCDVVARCLSQLIVVGDQEMRLEDTFSRALQL